MEAARDIRVLLRPKFGQAAGEKSLSTLDISPMLQDIFFETEIVDKHADCRRREGVRGLSDAR